MSVVATLVLGQDGSTTKGGTSQALSSAVDRDRFLARRRTFDCLIIGGKTARNERYSRTPVPVVIISHTEPDLLKVNDQAHWLNCSPVEAIEIARLKFGPEIGIEAGWSILSELLEAGAIDEFELSITTISSGEDRVDYDFILSHFTEVKIEVLDDTTFYSCR